MKPSGSPMVISSGPYVGVFCLNDSRLGFDAHQYAANQLEGHVVSILSAEDNWLIADISPGRTWIGFVDFITEGSFVWTDGSDVNFTSWSPNEPNNYKGNEDCTTSYWRYPGIWNDLPCSHQLPA
eukprot:scaffold359820_cov28-Attheya_sp.AAC.1